MPVTSDSINEAMDSGFTPDQIIDHIQAKYPEYKSKFAEAVQEGYSSSEIIDHLRGASKATVDQPAQQDPLMTPEHIQARTQLGLPAQPAPGKTIQETVQDFASKQTTPQISGLGAFYQGTGESMGVTASPEAVQQHPTARTLGNVAGLGFQAATALYSPVKGLLQGTLPKTMSEVGNAVLSKAMARSAVGQGAFGAASQFGMAKMAGVPTGLAARSAGVTGLISAGLAPAFSPLAREPFIRPTSVDEVKVSTKTMAETPIDTERQIYRSWDQYHADTNVAIYKAGKILNTIGKDLKQEQHQKIIDAGEHPERTAPDFTPEEARAHQQYKEVIGPLQEQIKKSGLVKTFNENYYKHLWGEQSLKELSPYIQKMPGAQKRTFVTFEDGVNFLSEKTKEVEAAGLTPKQVMKMTPQELTEHNLDLNMPRWMNMKPTYNLGASAGATLKAYEQTMATKSLTKAWADMRDERGAIFESWDKVKGNPNYTQSKLPGGVLEQYFFAGSKDSPHGRTVYLAKGPVAIRKDYAPIFERFLNPRTPYGEWGKLANEVNRVTKTLLVFNNPSWHMINLVSEGLEVMPGNISKAMGFGGRKLLNAPGFKEDMLAHGANLSEVYNLNNQLYQALGQQLKTSKIPVLSKAADVWSGVQHQTLWKYSDSLYANVWETYRNSYMKMGFPEANAKWMASEVANNTIGFVAKYKLPKLLQNPVFSKWVAFIPQWINASYQKMLGAVAPGVAFKSFSQAEQIALRNTYRQHLMLGATQWFTSSALTQQALTGKWPWEEDPHFFNNLAKGQMRLHLPGGYVVDNPFFKRLTLPARMIANAPQMLNPYLRMGLEQAQNRSPQSSPFHPQPIVTQGMSPLQNIGARAKAMREDFNILRTNSAMENPNGLGLMNLILPAYITKDLRPAGLVKMMDSYKKDNPREFSYLHADWMNSVDKAIKEKNTTLAHQIAAQHQKDSDWVNKRIMKFTKPITYSYYLIPEASRNAYFARLNQKEQKEINDKINMEAQQQ